MKKSNLTLKEVYINEAVDEGPTEKWAKFGDSVDDFINDSIDKINKLIDEGQKTMDEFHKTPTPDDDKMKNYMSLRLSYLKTMRARLAQKFESLRRNT